MSGLSRYDRDALRQLLALGVVELDSGDMFKPSGFGLLTETGEIIPSVLFELLSNVPGGADAIELLTRKPAASPAEVGQVFYAAHSPDWSDATTHSVGKHFRAWARHAGVSTLMKVPKPRIESTADALFDL